MRAYKKKLDAMDLLVTHRPPARKENNEPGNIGIDRAASEAQRKRLLELKKRLVRTHDRETISRILEDIQADYGNDVAEQVVKELRLIQDEDERH